MSYLITNRPWVDLSDFIHPPGLWDRLDLVAESIARSWHAVMPCVVGGHKNLLDPGRDLSDVAFDPTFIKEKKLYTEGMTFAQYLTFAKFSERSSDLALIISIRRTQGFGGDTNISFKDAYSSKHLAEFTFDTPVTQHWQWFIDWLKSVNVFAEIGRISCFINERGQSTTPHRDYNDGLSKRDQFLFFRSPYKKFWVMIDGQKHYLTSPISLFDNANYHGSDAPENPVWSIRVDGVFNNEFLERSFLKDHYALR